MPLFDECCVLIPASTLEDFPSDLSDYDARSLLAAWTILWHPCLLADSGQLPAWYRADSPPESLENRLFAVPKPSLGRLPEGLAARASQCPSCCWIGGETRSEMLEQLPLERLPALSSQHLQTSAQRDGAQRDGAQRAIEVEDFFAAGYALLQIQVMTRRLRYTSNLDEIHLQNRIVAAAEAFIQGDAEVACEALHDVFDALAEERDHYFSSDPHLIDLVLTSRSTLEPVLELVQRAAIHADPSQGSAATPASDAAQGESSQEELSQVEGTHGKLATPFNLLIDGEVAEAIADMDAARTERLRQALASGAIGWAGGGPPTSACLDAMTYAQAESVFEASFDRTREAIGAAPPVYGRFAGATPSDLTGTLVRLGYLGMIPIDFAGGTGFGDEAKVILQAAGAQLEALTAKPLDASSDSSFLTLGTKLGEAIDSGEIATALLAHWPGQECDSLEDLKRVASWSLCLGRFWNLADYFVSGEHPYHHGTATSTSPQSAELLNTMVAAETVDPLSTLAASFREEVVGERAVMFAGMRDLIRGKILEPSSNSVDGDRDDGQQVQDQDAAEGLAEAIGVKVRQASNQPQSTLLLNPHTIGYRLDAVIQGRLSAKPDHVYAVTSESGHTVATVDVPGCGFALLRNDSGGKQGPSVSGGSRGSGASGLGLGTRIREKLFGGPKPIANGPHLQNEFMEVTLSEESGAISGVYSGATRGNRFSFRLVRSSSQEDATLMRCDTFRVERSTPSVGCIEAIGTLRNEKASGDPVIATYRLRYTLQRGSRFLRIDGEIEPTSDISGSPWNHYFGGRVAVASETPICRSLIRDKTHRAKSRRIVAPLGVVIDESERQTLVCGEGLAFHRRVGDRFLDTLVLVQGEQCKRFALHYGFDVPAPVASARARIAPPVILPVEPSPAVSDIGWMLHAAPKDLLVSRLVVDSRFGGKRSAIVRVIQTQPQACKAKLRFLRNVEFAMLIQGQPDSLADQSLAELENLRSQQRSDLKHQDDQVTFSMPSHGVADLLVVFAD